MTIRKLILRSFLSPGDVLMLSAAIRDLHRAHPGRFETDVRTSADAIWLNNSHLTRLAEGDPGVESLDMHYPLVHQSNQRPYHFLHGYAQYLEEQLGVRIPLTEFRGDIHLSSEERSRPCLLEQHGHSGSFWIVVAGGKHDFTAKWWDPARFQAVVDHFQGKIQFVQCGEAGHWHPKLTGVIDLVGKTCLREFILLMHHADGVLCPVTLAMHLAAAVETKPGSWRKRPCVVVAGGREPPHWEAYPGHQFISTIGTLPCCASGGCWKSRCQPVGDGDLKDKHDLCEMPVQVTPDLRISRCLDLISPADVIRRIELYCEAKPKVPQIEVVPPPSTNGKAGHTAPLQPVQAKTDVLIDFRHGLGDAVQLTTVLRHLAHYHLDWNVDVAALVGKHSAYQGLCRRTYIRDREAIDRARYQQVFELDWHECPTSYGQHPSTKAEHCLLSVFNLKPVPELCGYAINVGQEASHAARRYLDSICPAGPGRDGRYRAALIHYQGNTSGEQKNLPHDLVQRLCEEIITAGAVPVILDWDNRSPLPDGLRIHNPAARLPLWGATGTGDAQTLAALIEHSALMIGVDSGPLHVAGATSTPTVGVWTSHHPLHYFGHADNVTHLVPEKHDGLLRGNPRAGAEYFQRNYRHETYTDLETSLRAAVRRHLPLEAGGLIYQRNFWIRQDNVQQDLVIVQDIAEEDSYRLAELPVPRLVMVDVGAHIGVFSRAFLKRHPDSRIIAVECCPENIVALERNVGEFAEVVQAAMTYEADVTLLNAVYADCVFTGGSTVISRRQMQERLDGAQRESNSSPDRLGQYWADLRPLPTVTLEELMEQHGIDFIDVLKLDCEGSEFSILSNTTLLDKIGVIVGEYHGREPFLDLVARRFAGWTFEILREGDPGTFWLTNAAVSGQVHRSSLELSGGRP